MGIVAAIRKGYVQAHTPGKSRVFAAVGMEGTGETDWPAEGDGFEPSVPGTKEPVFIAEGELRDRTGAAKKGCFLCGTDGSNPSPSSGESGANLIPGFGSVPYKIRTLAPRHQTVWTIFGERVAGDPQSLRRLWEGAGRAGGAAGHW